MERAEACTFEKHTTLDTPTEELEIEDAYWLNARLKCHSKGKGLSLESLDAVCGLGNLRIRQEKFSEALSFFEEGLHIRETLQLLECPDGASLFSTIAILKRMLGDEKGAADAYASARQTHTTVKSRSVDASMTAAPRVATSIHEFVSKDVCPRPKDPTELVLMAASCEEECEMMKATLTLNTPDGAELLINLGSIKCMQGDLEGAASCFQEARKLDVANRDVEKAVPDFVCDNTLPLRNPVAANMPNFRSGEATEAGYPALPRSFAAGSPLQAARQARRLEAELEMLKAV